MASERLAHAARRLLRSKSIVIGAGAAIAVALAATAVAQSPRPISPSPAPTIRQPAPAAPVLSARLQTGNVHGSIYVQPAANAIFVTDFPVYLKNVKTAAQTAPQNTDRYGRYYFRNQANGDYRLCWSAPGWTPGCASQLIKVRGNISYMLGQRVTFASRTVTAASTKAAMWGRVQFTDGSSPWFFNPYFGVKQEVAVTVRSGASVVATAYTNSAGQFVVPNLPFGTYQVTAQAGGGTVTATVAAGQGNPVTLQIRNKRPVIASVVTRLGGAARQEVPADAVLDVAADARDADGDTLKIVWKPAPANGGVSPDSGPSTTWKLPDRPGIMALYALASDGKGGFASGMASVSAGATETYFGVRLVDAKNGKTVTKADVTVNGANAVLGSKGMFVAKVPVSDRYVVNASAPSYIFMSRIFDRGGKFREMKLLQPALSTANPQSEIVLVDTRKNLREYGYVESAPASIRIKAGTLVVDGRRARGPLSAEIAALDISSEQFPGDGGAMVDDRDVGLISYGAMHVELRDGSGKRAQLASGATAEVTIPVPFAMKNPPSTIALWSYNEKTGFWDPLKGRATYDPGRRAYVGTVPHLSAFNVDLDQADLACFRVLLDNVQAGQLKARVSFVSGGPNFPATALFPIHDTLNVIKRLPPNSVVHLEVTDNAGAAVPNLILLDENQVVVPTGNFNTGPATLPHFPSVPYANCKTVSARVGAGATTVDTVSFLFAYSGEGDQARTIDYYLHMDAAMTHGGSGYSGGQHATLGSWWTLADFDATGNAADQAQQAYLNFNDLGFGRDMHIRKTGNNVYAYVTNYANSAVPDQNPLNAVYADNHDVTKIIATVAMESTGFAGLDNVVKFFVYAGADQNSPLVDSADLDGFGQKFVPQLCQVCHGGKPYPGAPSGDLDYALRTANNAVGAVFREFDLPTLLFPGDSTPGNIAALSAADKAQYFQLNQFVKDSGTQPVMSALIDGFYNLGAGNFDVNWAPATWAAPAARKSFYLNVVAKSCRTCHIAFDPTSVPLNTYNWEDYPTFTSQKGLIDFRVCSEFRFMPHALMTYRNFWLGGLGGVYEPTALANYNSPPEWTPAIGSCQ